LVVRCTQCGLLYVNPRPTQKEIENFYPDFYCWKETIDSATYFSGAIKKLEKIYRLHLLNYEVKKALKFTRINSGRILDVGCGTGDRLDIFRKNGFEVFGVEVSSSAKFAQESLKLNVFQGGLLEAGFADNFFDLITLYNVLEHTHNPGQVLREAHRILKKSGFLIIQVPNTDSLQFKIFQKRWAAFDVPRDLYYFNILLLKGILKKEDFEVLKIDHINNWWHPPTIVTSVFPSLDPPLTRKEGAKGVRAFCRRLSWVLLTAIFTSFPRLESMLKRGALITVYASKN
jgi:SAM-dependent methyltransferase